MIARRILVISRSPALSRAIQASLGPGYQVVTSTNVIDVEDEVRDQGPFDVLVAGPVFDSHAGMAVEDRPGDEDVERPLVAHFVLDVDDIGAGDDLVPRAERGLDGPAERR